MHFLIQAWHDKLHGELLFFLSLHSLTHSNQNVHDTYNYAIDHAFEFIERG
jgi:hypothetical protein